MQRLAAQTAAGTIFDTFTTAKTVINQQALCYIGGNTLNVGDSFRVTVRGAMTTLVTTPGTVTFQMMMGPTTPPTIIVWTSGAIQLNATAHTLLPFTLELDLTLQVINTTVGGAVAKFIGMGTLIGVMFTKTIAATDLWGRVSAADAAVSEVALNVPVTAPAQGTAFDSTVTNIFDFHTAFSVSSASNRIQIHQYFVDSTGGAAGG
jgi:hypothetical protein